MDRSQNVARAVGTDEVKTIYRCIHKSLNYLSQFLNGQIHGIKLMDLLFGTQTVSRLGAGDTGNISEKNNLPTSLNPRPPKKSRLVEGLVENIVQKPSERNLFVQHIQGTEPQGMRWTQQHVTEPQNPRNRSLRVSHTSSVSYQPPRTIPNTNIKVYQGSGPGTIPSPSALNPVASHGSYNPSIQSHLASSQSSLGFVGTFHQKAVVPNPYLGSFTPSSTKPSSNGRDRILYHHRSD
ncbi:Terminal uridylyltransferase 7 [Sesbania bispinosa]|nr:Terminal uridylyltransferase 7 [Sesbania bispinosa]